MAGECGTPLKRRQARKPMRAGPMQAEIECAFAFYDNRLPRKLALLVLIHN